MLPGKAMSRDGNYIASVATSGVRDPTEKHFTDTNSEDRSLAQGKQYTLKSCNQSLPHFNSSLQSRSLNAKN